MASKSGNKTVYLIFVGLIGWVIPGGGYFMIGERNRGIIVLITIAATFLIGIYIGSIGVIDPVGCWPWYIAQIMNTPLVAIISHNTSGGAYPVYAKSNEFGQIYTGIAGLLNLLCIVNSVYMAHIKNVESKGA